MADPANQERSTRGRFKSSGATGLDSADRPPNRGPPNHAARPAGVAPEDSHLSHSQAHRAERRFVQFYVDCERAKKYAVRPGARVSVQLGGKRRYGTIDSLEEDDVVKVVLDGTGEVVDEQLQNLVKVRSQLPRSLKRRWARELDVAGGPDAVSRAYKLWVKDLSEHLVVVRYKTRVFAALAAKEAGIIKFGDVKDVCDDIRGFPTDSANLIFDQIGLEAPTGQSSKARETANFTRRSGRNPSYQWTKLGREYYLSTIR